MIEGSVCTYKYYRYGGMNPKEHSDAFFRQKMADATLKMLSKNTFVQFCTEALVVFRFLATLLLVKIIYLDILNMKHTHS
jgi:hypothetical protein